MRTRRWNMNVCLGLLLVALKYSQWYFWSAMALACCAQADTFSAVIWFGHHSKWIALISQEHCYLDCWMKMKYCMMQVSERSVEMLPSVWCSWHFWELCRRLAIMLFAPVGFGSFCLSASRFWHNELVNPTVIITLPQFSLFTGTIYLKILWLIIWGSHLRHSSYINTIFFYANGDFFFSPLECN